MMEARAFEPEFLRRLDRLVLAIRHARTRRAGQRTVGRVQAAGIEPENFKEYSAGDDLRFLDWNAYARLDDLLIRTYRAERQVEVTVMLDLSASMAVPKRDDKFGIARAIAAALAYIVMADNDPVRIAAFISERGGVRVRATPFYRRREQYLEFRPFLSSLECRGQTRLSAAVAELMLQRRTAGVVILVSDLLVNQTDFEQALTRLATAHHEVKVIHVMGEIESTGTYPPGLYSVRDCETGELREVSFGSDAAERYRRNAADFSARLRNYCIGRSIAYAPAFGAGNLETIMECELPALGVLS